MSFVFNPSEHSRDDVAAAGCQLVRDFCRRHELRPPSIQHGDIPHAALHTGLGRGQALGLHFRGVIMVDLDLCVMPARRPGYAWSYPGYRADITPLGVHAHELGHYVLHHLKSTISRAEWDAHRAAWASVVHAEQPCTGYEPNEDEAFCEAFKIFVTNPDLLALGRPQRHRFLLGMGLEPLHSMCWREVLQHAHPAWIAAADRWVS